MKYQVLQFFSNLERYIFCHFPRERERKKDKHLQLDTADIFLKYYQKFPKIWFIAHINIYEFSKQRI